MASLLQKRVLVVDDSEPIRMALAMALEDELGVVVTVETAEEGLAAQRENPFDLLIVDRDLPGMSGPDLIRILKDEGATCDFLFITGHASRTSTLEVMEMGIAGFIEKPFEDIFDVADKIKELLISKARITAPKSPAPKPVALPPKPARPAAPPETLSGVADSMRKLREELSTRTLLTPAQNPGLPRIFVSVEDPAHRKAVVEALERNRIVPEILDDWDAVRSRMLEDNGRLIVVGLAVKGEHMIDRLATLPLLSTTTRMIVVGPEPSVDLLGTLINAGIGLFIQNPTHPSSRLTSRLAVELKRMGPGRAAASEPPSPVD
jgi:DNA-binding NtrC family response regulator